MTLLKPTWIPIAFAVFLFAIPVIHAQGIDNGDFEIAGLAPEPFESWTTFPVFSRPTDDDGAASFSAGGLVDDQQLQQAFFLPENAVVLMFELSFTSTPGGTTATLAANDSFQAALFNSSGDPVNSIGPFQPAFYALDSSGFEAAAAGTTIDLLATELVRISLDVSSIPAQELTLEFLILGDDDGLISVARVDNVVVFVPEPSTAGVLALLVVGTFIRRRSH